MYAKEWKRKLNDYQTEKEINSRELDVFFQTSKKQIQGRKNKTKSTRKHLAVTGVF